MIVCSLGCITIREGHTGLVYKKNGRKNSDEDNTEKVENQDAEAEIKDTRPADSGPDAGEAAQEAQQPETDAQGKAEEPKTVTEMEFLKICYEQSMRELNRVKGELDKKNDEIEQAKSEALQYKQKLSSVMAEYENFRRRSVQEKEAAFADAAVKAVSALLPALDSLEKAIEFAGSNPDSFKQGVEMTLRQMADGFKNIGVSEIEAEGATFDPEKHNAVMHVEDETLGDSVVAEVFQKGYAIGDRVVRHSVVKVAN